MVFNGSDIDTPVADLVQPFKLGLETEPPLFPKSTVSVEVPFTNTFLVPASTKS